ncbi:hypothetical protein GCM10011611_60540 [Aliidongia dinghuensis]|uniref:Alginate lyase n=1 Tax=Aliidongia dinghuensis TaxID=1867774 RepID=A0A8J2YZH2_9PROT|nr:hypothetical protein [Aliidongia dinghuensis]GGF45949.1 hypothetical protein GCM10011611_60540 [Aliidongia dinghuensis]
MWRRPLLVVLATAFSAVAFSTTALARAETFDPQAVLAQAFPEMRALRKAMKPEIVALEVRLDAEEQAGADRSCLRQAVTELRWLLASTSDVARAEHARDRLRERAAAAVNPAGSVQDADGSYGPCVEDWAWKLDASTDRFLSGAPMPVYPRLLDRVNDPARLDAYLTGLLQSDLRRDGVDRRKELNIASADLVRLILRRKPAGYPWRDDLEPVVRRFIAAAQDPSTGFFGESYRDGERTVRMADLSVTFHIARYLDGKIDHWPTLIDHLIAMKDAQYPYGWLDDTGMTSHNNYDVATLFRLGWPALDAGRQHAVAAEIAQLLDWCLGTALGPDGEIKSRAVGESWPDALYFTAAFLDEVGFLDPRKRYWTDRPLPDPTRIRAGLAAEARKLPADEPMARAALDRLAQR